MYRVALRTALRTAIVPSLRVTGLRSFSFAVCNRNDALISNQSANQIIKRSYSVIDITTTPEIDYNKMKQIVMDQDPNYVIVDVREPDEFNAGHIPGAINIPCKSSPGALGLDEVKFKEVFGFEKPKADKTLVFYCLAGIRSRMSEELAATYGYDNRINYAPSFSDWMANNGKIEKLTQEQAIEKDSK